MPRRASTSHLARIALTRSDTTDSEVSSVHGLRVTSPTRTAADLSRRLPFVEAVVALDMGVHRRLVTLDQLRHWADRHPGFHGIRQLRRALAFCEPASESAMETRLRMLLVLNRLPRPVAQARLLDESGLFLARTDLYYPSARLAIEYDGAIHRSTLAADNRRQNRLLEAGYQLLRFTASDIYAPPASVVAQVSRGLRR